MPGIDRKRFVGVSDQELDEYCCGICLEVFSNPVFSPCCRQTYCSDCINQWLTQHNTCPNDRKTLSVDDLITAPRVLINILNNMKINCDFHTNGCETVSRLSDLPKHTEICSFNPNRKCENCGLSVGNDHNCIHNLKVKNESINDEIIRIRNENSDLKVENQRLGNERNEISNLKTEIKTINDEIIRLRNENSELRAENKRLEKNRISELGTKDKEIIRLGNENTVLKEENQRLQRSVSSNPTFDRNDRTLRIIDNEMKKRVKDYALSIGFNAYDLFNNDVEPNGKMAEFVVDKFENKFDTDWNCVVSTDICFDYSLHLGDNNIDFKIGQFQFVIWEE